MKNPWEILDLSIYENHMNLENVDQIPLLNKIMKSQLSYFNVDSVAIWGIAGGNGLEHISCKNFKKVHGIDINSKYLNEIKRRFPDLNCLILEKLDLNDLLIDLPETGLVIANLLIEYIGLNNFLAQVTKINPKYISRVIQEDNTNFVTDSSYSDSLKNIGVLSVAISKNELINKMGEIGYNCILKEEYFLLNNKKFIRTDFNSLII